MTTNAARLAQAVRARREQLDLSQLDVGQAGGPSNTTLTEIENGRVEKLSRTTARKLDVGLQWEPGSAKRAWEGGEPTPLRPTRDLEDLRRRVQAAEFLSDEQKAEILASIDRAQADPPAEGQVRGA
jgi:transcriptional regulator with XRE-family HTH domain